MIDKQVLYNEVLNWLIAEDISLLNVFLFQKCVKKLFLFQKYKTIVITIVFVFHTEFMKL